jgi:hypothetical protein
MPAPQRQQAHSPDIWFAQTVAEQQQRMLPPMYSEDKSFLPGVGLFALPTCLCIALLVVARPNGAQSPTAGAKANRPAKAIAARQNEAGARLVVAQRTETIANGPTVEPPSDGTERLPLSYYTSGIRGSMFGAPVPPPPKPVVQKPIVVKKPEPAPKIEVPPINPFADWAYTGTIRMGEQTMALLENTKTKEGQYVKVGERFLGTEITAISDQEVTIGGGTTANRIAKSDTITVTALDKPAPFLSGGGQPGMPGQPGGAPAMPMPPPGGQVITPGGRVFNQGNMEQFRQQMMDRRFNRGLNGGGNGGGFDFGGRGRGNRG